MKRVTPPRRVLIVSLRFLGDALLSTPLARAVKRQWPGCSVDMLVFAGTEGIFEGNRDVASVVPVAEAASVGATLRQALPLARRYDLALVTQTGTRPFVFGIVSGRRRFGLVSPEPGKSWWKRMLLDRYAVLQPGTPRVEENRLVAGLLGIDELPGVVGPSAGWSTADISAAVGFDVTAQRYAIVHPAPRWRYKQWTDTGWQRLIARLADAGLRVVITGGAGDEEHAYLDRVLEGRTATLVSRVDGRWSFAQTADALRHAALFVGPDTATTHLAAACGTPTVAVYGPTDPSIWGPWPATTGAPYQRVAAQQHRGNVLLLQNADLACVPCQQEGCERHRLSHAQCLDELTAERVIEAALEQLHRGERQDRRWSTCATTSS